MNREKHQLAACVAMFALFCLIGCGKDNQDYQEAYKNAYKRTYQIAFDKARDEGYKPAFNSARSSEYKSARQELVVSGDFAYNRGWLVFATLTSTLAGFLIEHRITAALRRNGILRGDIHRFLFGASPQIEVSAPALSTNLSYRREVKSEKQNA